jgi:hypothetical protein
MLTASIIIVFFFLVLIILNAVDFQQFTVLEEVEEMDERGRGKGEDAR